MANSSLPSWPSALLGPLQVGSWFTYFVIFFFVVVSVVFVVFVVVVVVVVAAYLMFCFWVIMPPTPTHETCLRVECCFQ